MSTHTSGEAEEIDITPRTPEELAARLLIQATLLRRVMIELEHEDAPDDGLNAPRLDDIAILFDRGIWDSAAQWERDFMESPVGEVDY